MYRAKIKNGSYTLQQQIMAFKEAKYDLIN